MKFLIALAFILPALAAPVADANLETRQFGSRSSTSNDFSGRGGGCKGVVMIYARGSTESGNVGTLGGPLKTQLNEALNNDFALQGVEYPASLADNFQTGGTSQSNIRTMIALIQEVATKCPQAKIVCGGYSQGSALAARSIEKLSPDIVTRISAVVMFGYTQNKQLNGGVPGLPQDKLLVICNPGDEVCEGTLSIKTPHLQYGPKVPQAVSFIVSKVK